MFLLFLNFTKHVGKATADLEIVRICCDPNKGDARDHLDGSAKTALTHNGPLSTCFQSFVQFVGFGFIFQPEFRLARGALQINLFLLKLMGNPREKISWMQQGACSDVW